MCIKLLCFLLIVYVFLTKNPCFGQQDSMYYSQEPYRASLPSQVFRKCYLAPSILLTYGLTAIKNPFLQAQNQYFKQSLQERNPMRIHLDDYTQYASQAAFLSLDALGVRAKHPIQQRLFTGLVSHAIMASVVNLMKKTVPIMRPDGSADNSFPSGHTATAFVGAELLWQEYYEKNIWYGVAGYAVATGTGFFRMHNNKHWFSDVAMGAGIGIMSTKIAYWLLPSFESKCLKLPKNYSLVPSYNGEYTQLSLYVKL